MNPLKTFFVSDSNSKAMTSKEHQSVSTEMEMEQSTEEVSKAVSTGGTSKDSALMLLKSPKLSTWRFSAMNTRCRISLMFWSKRRTDDFGIVENV
jgi:hypothetical protein